MFERCLYFNVNALARRVNRIWDQAFAELGLSPAHAYLVRLLLAEPGLTPKQAATELRLDKSTITRFVDALETKGLVRRAAADGVDGRRLGLLPTAKARHMAQSLEVAGEQLYQRMGSALGKQQLNDLVIQLRHAAQALDRVLAEEP